MRICEWCKIKLAFDGELCSDCTVTLAPKNQVYAANAKVDEHVQECVFCEVPKLCMVGTMLLIDAEYIRHFGAVDPQEWFRHYGDLEISDHG